eukprot:scaffold71225_cov38-Cyclotella_meneghiniana.AAC.5
MAMVEVPGGSAVGGRSNHGRRATPFSFFLKGRLEKAERRAGSRKQVPTARTEIFRGNRVLWRK